MVTRRDGIIVASAFAAGAALGAAVALLTAPRSGRETRKRVGGLAEQVGHKVSALPNAAREACDSARETFADSMRGA
jgi:gas vesicle protein